MTRCPRLTKMRIPYPSATRTSDFVASRAKIAVTGDTASCMPRSLLGVPAPGVFTHRPGQLICWALFSRVRRLRSSDDLSYCLRDRAAKLIKGTARHSAVYEDAERHSHGQAVDVERSAADQRAHA